MRFPSILAAVLLTFFYGSPAQPGEGMKQGVQSMDHLPLYFIENKGQVDGEVSYYIKGSDRTLFFTETGITFALTGMDGQGKQRWISKLEFVGADPVEPRGENRREAIFSYFTGKRDDWKTGVPTFGKLVYSDLWPGIDLVYSGIGNQLKYEFMVAAGADPEQIRLAYSGVTDLSVKETGELVVSTPAGAIEDGVPIAYQVEGDKQKEVALSYSVEKNQVDGARAYGFEIGEYDPGLPLIVDPVFLIYCGYIGGAHMDSCAGIAVDDFGCVYISGNTYSDETSFPVTVGPDLTYNGDGSLYDRDIFVAKLNAAGTGLLYCGYIGGANGDECYDIAIDDEGNAYVAGYTESDEGSFPVTVGPDLTYNGDGTRFWGDCFVAKVNSDGTGLVYCGYIGGFKDDGSPRIAVDNSGCAYVVGETESDETTFPVTVGPDLTFNGNQDLFIAKVGSNGSGLDFCGYIGGAGYEQYGVVSVGKAGYPYVTGTTMSDETTFPVTVGPDLTHNGSLDAFVAKVDKTGTGLLYCGYIGGEDVEYGRDIAVDDTGNLFIAGSTQSDEASFPVKTGPFLTYDNYYDAFVAKLNSSGTEFFYCGYIGGDHTDHAGGIAIDSEGCAYVSGFTQSHESTFPLKIGPDLIHGGAHDAFIAKVAATGGRLVYCGYIGGSDYDSGGGIAVDDSGCAYVAGHTSSDEASFPVVVGPDLEHNGSQDGFVAKVMYQTTLVASPDTLPVTGGTVDFKLHGGVENANRSYFLLGSLSGILPGSPLPGGQNLPLNWDLLTDLILSYANTPVFTDFLGVLDAAGEGEAQLNSVPVPPAFSGAIMTFAWCLYNPFDVVSDPLYVWIE